MTQLEVIATSLEYAIAAADGGGGEVFEELGEGDWYRGMFPCDDNVRNTRYAINFFTSIGLGPLTDGLRRWVKDAPRRIMEAAKKKAELAKLEERDEVLLRPPRQGRFLVRHLQQQVEVVPHKAPRHRLQSAEGQLLEEHLHERLPFRIPEQNFPPRHPRDNMVEMSRTRLAQLEGSWFSHTSIDAPEEREPQALFLLGDWPLKPAP